MDRQSVKFSEALPEIPGKLLTPANKPGFMISSKPERRQGLWQKYICKGLSTKRLSYPL